MRELGRQLTRLRRRERGLAGLLVFTYALTLFGLYLLKPARDSYFLSSQSAADLPLAFILSAGLAVPVSLAYGRASQRWALGRLLAASFGVLVAGLVVWRWLLETPWPAVPYLFYAWVAIAGGLVTAQFWLVGNAVCDARQAKQVFPILSLGGILGAIAGGWAARWVAGRTAEGVLDLVLACAGLWALVGILNGLVLRRRRVLARAPRPAADDGVRPARQFARDLAGSAHLRLIIGLVAVSIAVSTFVDFQFKSVAAAAYPDGTALLGYLGGFYAQMNLLSLALQLLVTSRLLRGLGVGGAIMVLPTLLTLGLGALLAAPLLPVAATVRAGEMGLKYSVDKTSRELLFLPLPLGLKRRVKVFIDTFVERLSRGLAGGMLWLMTGVLGVSVRGTAVVALVLTAVWLALAVQLRRHYAASFRAAVARREFDEEDLRTSLRDPGAVAALTTALASSSTREVAYALALLRSVPRQDLPAAVPDLLTHPEAAIRLQALMVIHEVRVEGLQETVAPLLCDPDPEISRLAAAYLHREGGLRGLQAALAGAPGAQEAVLDYVARQPAGEPVPHLLTAEQARDHLADRSLSARHRTALAEYLGRIWTGDLASLRAALEAQGTDLLGPALAGLGRQARREDLAPLAGLLADRDLRVWARRALTAIGPAAVPALADVVTRTEDAGARRAALRALSRLPLQRTVDLLLSRADTDRARVREGIVPVLVRLRERRPRLRFPARAVEPVLRRETDAARRLAELEARLGLPPRAAAERLLRRSLREVRRAHLARSFQLLALRYDVGDIMGAWLRLQGPDATRRGDALEFLENLLRPGHRVLLQGLLEEPRSRRRPARRAALRQLLRGDDPWLRACAARAVTADDLGALRADLEDLTRTGAAVDAETARQMLDDDERSGTMLTTIEKAILLEGVEHFDAVDARRLAAIAAIADEVTLGDGDPVYHADDPGDAMYLVVDGAVELRRGGQKLARAGAGEVFGAWALFEPETRMVDAVAAGECRLLRIGRDEIADLMAEDITVAQSLLLSVARRLRELASRAA
jgi:ATP/ADP translocase